MSTQRKFEIQSVIEAIHRVGASPSAVAKELNTTRSTINRYRKRYPEIAQALAGAEPIVGRPMFPRELFEKAIVGSRGIKSVVANRAGVSRATVENALERWPDLLIQLNTERADIIDMAESQLVRQVLEGEMRAILFTLETLGKDRGWTKRTEITGRDGENLLALPADIVTLMQKMGVDPAAEMMKFAEMVRERAAQVLT